jgi:hypothetical protein
VPLHHKFHERDSVYTQRCALKYAGRLQEIIATKLRVWYSPNLNTERNAPYHEGAKGNGRELIKNKLNQNKLQSKQPMKCDYQPKTHWVICRS